MSPRGAMNASVQDAARTITTMVTATTERKGSEGPSPPPTTVARRHGCQFPPEFVSVDGPGNGYPGGPYV